MSPTTSASGRTWCVWPAQAQRRPGPGLRPGEDDLGFVLQAESDETVRMADGCSRTGRLQRLLRRGRFGQERRQELRAGPDVLEVGPVDAGLGKGPPDQIAEGLAAGTGDAAGRRRRNSPTPRAPTRRSGSPGHPTVKRGTAPHSQWMRHFRPKLKPIVEPSFSAMA